MKESRLGLHVTDRCQLDCEHCLRDPERKVLDLSLDLALDVVGQAKRTYGIECVSLTGGEPTLYPQLDELLASIAEQGLRWDMVTNGHRLPLLLGRWSSAIRASCRSVSISLDGATEAVHDGIRAPGSYRRVLQAVSACGGTSLPFGIQMALNRRNHQELEQLGLLAAQLGAKSVSFAWLQPTGTEADRELYLTPKEWRMIQRRIQSLSGALAIKVILPEGHYQKTQFALCAPFRSETLHVDLAGRLTLCCLHSGIPSSGIDAAVGGDLHHVSLVEAHRGILHIIHRDQEARLNELQTASGKTNDEWEGFHCNRCLQRYGRPYWTAGGSAGPVAARERRRTQAFDESSGESPKRRLVQIKGG